MCSEPVSFCCQFKCLNYLKLYWFCSFSHLTSICTGNRGLDLKRGLSIYLWHRTIIPRGYTSAGKNPASCQQNLWIRSLELLCAFLIHAWESFPTRPQLCPPADREEVTVYFLWRHQTRTRQGLRPPWRVPVNTKSPPTSRLLWTPSTVYTYLFHLFPPQTIRVQAERKSVLGEPRCALSSEWAWEDATDTNTGRGKCG